MQPFLETLASYLVHSSSGELGDTRVILPNRRSGLFLQRHLTGLISRTTWAPRIYAIGDFIEETSRLDRADPVDLLFTLYDIYRDSVEHPDTLDDFYLWGEMMLTDFDELDKYQVDAELLFSNILDLKELEEPAAGLEPGQITFIRQFWKGFHEGDPTPEKEQFLRSWTLLPELYHRLRKVLTERGEGYQGMLYRELAERSERGELDLGWEGRTIIAGFNALNQCEKRIFSDLQLQGAGFFWDFDHQYTDNVNREAGRFLRDNMRQFPSSAPLEEFRGLSKEKKYTVFELPTDVLQAKTVHMILDSKEPRTLQDCTDTAVVLCDEELLLPVLTSLPGGVGELNVTMGYPMKNTPVYSFIDSLLRMQHNIRRTSGGKVQFYHRDVMAILSHPYFRKVNRGASGDQSVNILKNNLIMIDRELFTGEFEKILFSPVEDAAGLLDYIRNLFDHILTTQAVREEVLLNAMDREFIFQLLTHLNKLESLIVQRTFITVSILERLLRKSLGRFRVPFEGEPLSGLQMMGILETRLLDFKHVMLLSMNEEVMPASHPARSNIPYSLRLAFGMPSREDMDAIYAYYFYRLLQRAERVDLIFNGGSEGLRTGEMSRYIHQLIFSKGLQVKRPGFEVRAREVQPLIVPHTADVEEKLKKYRTGAGEEKYLSPSALNTYIDCSLRFYLRYIAGIGEPDEISEDVDASVFGTVVHDALKELYNEIAERNGRWVTRDELLALIHSSKPEEMLRRIFIKHHFKGRRQEVIEGRNIITFRVMLRYLERIIQTDIAVTPFELLSAENEFRRVLPIEVNGRILEIRMGGKIDRIDRVNGVLRVIDYKTGQAGQKFASIDSLFERDFGNRNGAAMQTLFYAWLVGEEYAGEEVMPGLYAMKHLFEDQFDPALRMTNLKTEGRIGSFSPHEQQFIQRLSGTLQQLFDPGKPFDQRENDRKCSFCDFVSLCQRNPIG